jgi:hypothetical protein
MKSSGFATANEEKARCKKLLKNAMAPDKHGVHPGLRSGRAVQPGATKFVHVEYAALKTFQSKSALWR